MINEINESFIFEDNDLLKKEDVEKYLKYNCFGRIIGYFISDVMIGYIFYSYIYTRIELDDVNILEEYRNKKIGSKLLEYIILNNIVDNISLEVCVNNYNAIKLYSKYNFKIIRVIKNYYDNEDAYMMIRS